MNRTPTTATPDASASAAELIYSTDPGVWDYLFDGHREVFNAFAEALWVAPDNSFSHSEAVEVLDADGTRVALQVAYSGKVERALTREVNRISAAALTGQALHGLLGRARYIDYLTPHIPTGDLYLHFLAVAPEARGKGLGRALLTHFENRGREAGARALHLDVYCDNPAVNIYRAFGFDIVVETAFPQKAGLPPHYRMIKEIQ